MTQKLPPDLRQTMTNLETALRNTAPADLLDLQADLHRLCEKLAQQGYEVPDRLRALDQLLTETLAEAQFDNLPL